PELGRPAACDQLLGLHEEFDLANTAAAKLDVMAFDGDFIVTAKSVHLPLHGMHVGDRRMIEIATPHERENLAQETLACFQVTCRRTRLDEHRALPCLPFALVIGKSGVG